ncbi:MAG: hypothetical protein AAF694_21520 [Bacteroidota bacterium]
MKKNSSLLSRQIGLFFLLNLAMVSLAFSQDSIILDLNIQRLQINKTGMYILGGWAVANIAGGAILRSQTTGTTRYFHEMNMFWNFVNLGLAGAGLYGSLKTDPSGFSAWESLQEQRTIEKLLLFNAALDIAYITGGAYMIERSRRVENKPERIKGYGQSLILQGSFLLVFDATLYLIHNQAANPKLQQLLSHVSFSGDSLSLVLNF